MKKTLIASLLVIGLASGLAYAHGNKGSGYGYGGHMMGGGGGYGQMGPGMMGYGYGPMGPGMMGGGYGPMGPGMMGGYGSGYNSCPGAAYFGENGWNSEMHQKFLDDTVEIRKKLNEKNFEYAEARRNPDTSQEQIAGIEKEIINLRTQLQDIARKSFNK